MNVHEDDDGTVTLAVRRGATYSVEFA
jgi:hypothetical protein